MNTRDLDLITGALREAELYMTQRDCGTINPAAESALRFVAGSIALELELDDSSFDRDAFFAACGDTFANSLA